MATPSICVVLALAIASCVTVSAEVHNPYDDQYYAYDPSYTSRIYKPPCTYNYQYNPSELGSLEKTLQTCMKDLPSRRFPHTSNPQLDCARAGVDSLQNAQSRTVAGVPAAVSTCLRLPRYASILNESIIAKAEACIKKAVAKGL